MPADTLSAWQPTDQLFLWWLANPQQPRLVGDLQLVRALRGVSLRYGDAWLRQGFPLSEDLPLIAGERLPVEKESAAGAMDDARPDRWGERVIRQLDRPARLSLLEYLYFSGDDRFGALGVSASATAYLPRRHGPLPHLADVARMAELIQQVMDGEPVPETERRLVVPGVSMGGARPKALLDMDGQHWVLKFSEPSEPFDMPLVEHATMTLAALAGIRVADTRTLALPKAHAVAVRRFDRVGGQRLHALSAHVALRAAGEGMGYPELAQLLRRRGVAQAGQGRAGRKWPSCFAAWCSTS